MPQNLIQLPKEADFLICGWNIIIQNHMVAEYTPLLGCIMNIVNDSTSQKDILCQFEKHGISFEAAIECCCGELEENDIKVFAKVIRDNVIYAWMMPNYRVDWNSRMDFAKSLEGRKIASQFIEKIRSCGNWGELYAELQYTSKFSKDMKNRIKEEMKQ